MKKVFVDTSAWLALIDKDDRNHAAALQLNNILREQKITYIISDYIIAEIANCLSKLKFRDLCVKLINSILNTPNIQIVNVEKSIFEKAWLLYSDRKDKEWGFTDCTSFIIMRDEKILDAFTNDSHFTQSGFNILDLENI